AVWAAGDNFAQGEEIFVLDFATGQRRSLGPGRLAQFLADGTVLAPLPGGNDRVVIDPVTGDREPFVFVPEGDEKQPQFADASALPSSSPPGYRVEPEYGGPVVAIRTVTDLATGDVVLTFEAVAVAAAGPGELAVVAPPVED